MRRTVLFLTAILTSVAMMAATFTGKVIDENNQPFPYANVVLLNSSDSTYITGTTTGEDGTFTLPTGNNGIIVKISYIGYATKYINPGVDNLGMIQLLPEATMLGEVVVKGTRPIFKVTTEGIKTDVDGTLLSKVGTASDVLQNLPGVQKKSDGIEVFGKGTPLVYINGRVMRNKSELDQLKSDDIESVELITNPGAKYKADVESVILIKTKRPQGEGFSFDAETYYYQGNNMDLAVGLNWNYRKGGLDIFGSEWYNEDNWHHNDGILLDVKSDTIWHLDQFIYGRTHSRSLYNSVGVNYVLGDNHSMGLRYDTKWNFKNNTWGSMTADVTADGDFYDHLVNTVDQDDKSNMPHTINAYYNGKIGKTSIDVNLDYMFYKDRTNQYNNEVSQEQDSRIVTAQSVVRNQLLAGKLVLSWPLWGGNLQAGSELSNTHRNDDYINPEQIVPTSFTEQRERNYAFFVEYARPLPFGQMRLGLRNENVCSNYYSMGELVPDQSRTYHHLFPTIGLSARAGSVQFMLNYAMKIQRPYYWQLNGSVTYGNRFTWESGNPTLKPSINNQLSFVAMYKWINLMVDFKRTSDVIVNVAKEVPGSEATTLITRDNVDHADALRVMLNLAPQFGIYQPQLSISVMKDWVEIPSPTGFISPKRPFVFIQFYNNIRILPTLTASANMSIVTKGDKENMSLTKAGLQADLSVTKTFFNDRFSIKVAGLNIFDAQEHIDLNYGLRHLHQDSHYDSRKLQVTLRYKFNTVQSKYRGSGAGSDEKARLGK
ncbi:MAG: outer membrane beta-barrel protein [Muribaculaceae bacterium]|nr:outer membrane beta-barrel protein [Muribaculaceae bacterium]